MKRLTLIFAASVVFVSQAARAEDSGAYFGAGVATDSSRLGCTNATATCNNYTTTAGGGHLHLVGGYDFNRIVGIEAGWENFGTVNAPNSAGTTVGTAKISAATLAAKVGYRFQSGWSVFGKIGLAHVWTAYSPGPGWALAINNNQSSAGVVLGFAGQYDFNDTVGIRLAREAVGYRDAAYDSAVGATSLMAIFRF